MSHRDSVGADPRGSPSFEAQPHQGADSLQLLVDVGLRDSAWLAVLEWLVVIGEVPWPVVSGPVRVALENLVRYQSECDGPARSSL